MVGDDVPTTPAAVFDWDEAKDRTNREKHGVGFERAKLAFSDPRRVIRADLDHSAQERRFFCLGMVAGDVLTVRFTLREGHIRIFGAGYWRKGRRTYEQDNG